MSASWAPLRRGFAPASCRPMRLRAQGSLLEYLGVTKDDRGGCR
jgi:hypothetical protein